MRLKFRRVYDPPTAETFWRVTGYGFVRWVTEDLLKEASRDPETALNLILTDGSAIPRGEDRPRWHIYSPQRLKFTLYPLVVSDQLVAEIGRLAAQATHQPVTLRPFRTARR